MSYFQTLARGDLPTTTPWVPFLETLAAAMEGCSLADLLNDATRWSNALPRAAKLLNAPVVAVGFVDTFGLEAFSARLDAPWAHPALATLIECSTRLAAMVRPAREIVIAVPGPQRILAHLGQAFGRESLESLKPTLVKLLEQLAEQRPDLLVLNETGADLATLAGNDYRRICNTLKNVTDYFGIGLGLRLAEPVGSEAISALRSLRLEHLMVTADPATVSANHGWQSLGLGVTAAPPAPPQAAPCYWCSAAQEADLDQARLIAAGLLP